MAVKTHDYYIQEAIKYLDKSTGITGFGAAPGQLQTINTALVFAITDLIVALEAKK